MLRSRRQFLESLTVTGCAVCLAPRLLAVDHDNRRAEDYLRRVIGAYGAVVDLETRGNRVEVQVRILDIRNLPRACRAFSRSGSVYARGNDLHFTAGHRRVRIQNQF